jgi:hypothetical protein
MRRQRNAATGYPFTVNQLACAIGMLSTHSALGFSPCGDTYTVSISPASLN